MTHSSSGTSEHEINQHCTKYKAGKEIDLDGRIIVMSLALHILVLMFGIGR